MSVASTVPDPSLPAVRLGPRGLVVFGRELPFFAGAMHYAGTAPRNTVACLRAMRTLGYTVVDTTVPWSAHDKGAGRLDFSGAFDLGAFLDACHGEGFPVLLRIGPRTGGELTRGGFPERIVTDGNLLSRTAAGHPSHTLDLPRGYPTPSYASRLFLDEVRRYWGALAEVVGPRLAPAGPVALLQIDHELGGFLRAGPFCGDYHPDALAAWHAEEGDAPPPRRFDSPSPEAGPTGLSLPLRWLRFRERRITSALGALGELLDEAGLGSVPRIHGFAPLDPVTFDVAAAESRVAAAAVGFHFGLRDQARTARLARYLAGSSRFPLAAPLAIGSSPWGALRSDDDGIASLLGALMHGAVGYSACMAVARDRWVGAPIDETGRIRPGLGEPLGRIHGALVAAGWSHLTADRPLGLLLPRDYGRLGLLASRLGPLAPLGARLGLEDGFTRSEPFGLTGPVHIESRHAAAALSSALAAAGLPWVIVDDSCAPERLAALGALVVPTFDFLDRGLSERLASFASGGGALLSGPRAPTRGADLEAAEHKLPGARFDAALLASEPGLVATLIAFAAGAGIGAHRPSERAEGGPGQGPGELVETRLYRREGGTPALLFAANPSARATTFSVADSAAPGVGAAALAATCAVTGRTFAAQNDAIPLAPFEVRLLTLG